MRNIRSVLRLKWGEGKSNRKVAEIVGVSASTVSDYVQRAKQAGLSWPIPGYLNEEELEEKLFPSEQSDLPRALPDFSNVHKEMRRKHTTLSLLWDEYKEEHENGYGYSQFCSLYREWSKTVDVYMRQTYIPGERVLVDFAGDKVPIKDPNGADDTEADLFVGVLGASSYTYAEVCDGQDLHSWVKAHVGMFSYFGGVASIWVPDNLKSGVTKACRYEPLLNRTYEDLADHYGAVVLPARVRKPRDKAKAENGVLVAERWILARLRNHKFFSKFEANEAVQALLPDLNGRPFQKLTGSRLSWFEELDRPALRPLPERPYQMAEWQHPRLGSDYHVQIGDHFYSVPHTLNRRIVDVRYTDAIVEVHYRGPRVAAHARNHRPGKTTEPAHMPKRHRALLDYTPTKLIERAQKVGPHTGELVEALFEQKKHPAQGVDAAIGVLRLARKYETERVEAACRRAVAGQAISYRSVERILAAGLDAVPLDETPAPRPPVLHPNIRGADYYRETDDMAGSHGCSQACFALPEPSANPSTAVPSKQDGSSMDAEDGSGGLEASSQAPAQTMPPLFETQLSSACKQVEDQDAD